MSVRINLLPEARMIKLKNQQTKRLVTVICVVLCSSVGIILIVLLLLLGARNVQYASNKAKIEDDLNKKLESKKNIEQDLAWFNGAVLEAYTLSNNRVLISQLFDRLTDAAPDGIKITNLSVDEDYAVKASVEALDYNNVALFMNALRMYNVSFGYIPGFEREPVFHDIDVQSVTKGKEDSGADFEITFVVDEKLVEKFRKDSTADEDTSSGESE
jgi:Tfp pilus assembly protein PilN